MQLYQGNATNMNNNLTLFSLIMIHVYLYLYLMINVLWSVKIMGFTMFLCRQFLHCALSYSWNIYSKTCSHYKRMVESCVGFVFCFTFALILTTKCWQDKADVSPNIVFLLYACLNERWLLRIIIEYLPFAIDNNDNIVHSNSLANVAYFGSGLGYHF